MGRYLDGDDAGPRDEYEAQADRAVKRRMAAKKRRASSSGARWVRSFDGAGAMVAFERVTLDKLKTHKGTAIALGRDAEGFRVAVAVDRQTWLAVELAGLCGGIHDAEVESWRIVARRSS